MYAFGNPNSFNEDMTPSIHELFFLSALLRTFQMLKIATSFLHL